MESYLSDWREWLWSVVVGGGAILVALTLHSLLFAFLRRVARDSDGTFYSFLTKGEYRPSRILLPLLALLAVLPWSPFPAQFHAPVMHAIWLASVAAVAWMTIALLDALQDFVSLKHSTGLANDIEARQLRTQVQVLRHIAVVVIVIIALAIMLMTFPSIRHLGESLFASAGLAALVAGLAARTTLSSLLAGVQIALTQPIRLEDAVIVEGEWGWIEEITTTYVIVRVWDLRRLVVPLSYFIEKPFQNWTRRTADLLGTVFIYTDYTVPVDEIRQELYRILKSSNLWDGKVWGLQVTNASERTMELRALMSAADGPSAFDLRCLVREKLIEFLKERYPECLPRTRAEIQPLATEAGQRGEFAA